MMNHFRVILFLSTLYAAPQGSNWSTMVDILPLPHSRPNDNAPLVPSVHHIHKGLRSILQALDLRIPRHELPRRCELPLSNIGLKLSQN